MLITIIKMLVGAAMVAVYFIFSCGFIINAMKQVARDNGYSVPEKASIYAFEIAIGMLAWIFIAFSLLMR